MAYGLKIRVCEGLAQWMWVRIYYKEGKAMSTSLPVAAEVCSAVLYIRRIGVAPVALI